MNQVEGQLSAVAESWPLQLTVLSSLGAVWAVSLDESTRFRLGGRTANAADLRVGQRLRASGSLLGPEALLALQIDIEAP